MVNGTLSCHDQGQNDWQIVFVAEFRY